MRCFTSTIAASNPRVTRIQDSARSLVHRLRAWASCIYANFGAAESEDVSLLDRRTEGELQVWHFASDVVLLTLACMLPVP